LGEELARRKVLGGIPIFNKILIGLEISTVKGKAPKSRFRNCHCEGTEAISLFSMRLPRTLQVLAMTDWEKGFSF